MAVDFGRLLRSPAGKGKRPKALPAHPKYPAIVRTYELGDKNKNNTPYVRIHCTITAWPDEIDQSDRVQEGANGELIPIDLSKRQMHRDIFYQGKDGEDMTYRLDDFLKSCGLDLSDGLAYEQYLPQLQGKEVWLSVSQYLNERTNEIGNQTDNIIGMAA